MSDAGRLRRDLADADHDDNRALWYVIAERLGEIGLGADRLAEAAPLVDWLDLVAGYTGESATELRAEARFLDALVRHARGGEYSRARAAYEDAAREARQGGSSRLLPLIMYGHAQLEADYDDRDEADRLFGEALAAGAQPELLAELHDARERARRQADLADSLVESGTPPPDRGLIDRNLIDTLRARLLRAAVGGDVDSARRVADVVDELDPTPGGSPALRELSLTLISRKRNDDAATVLQDLMARHPDDTKIVEDFATVLLKQHEPAAAADVLSRLAEQQPGSARIHHYLSLAYWKLEDLERAEVHAHRATELDPEDEMARHFRQRLEELKARKALHQTQASLVKAAAHLAAHPERAPQIMQALSETKGREYALAVAQLANRIATGGGPPDVPEPAEQATPLRLAEDAFSQGRHEEAIEHYRAAIEQDPDNAFAFMGWGDCYYHLGRFYLAAAYFAESNAVEPSPQAHTFRGDALAHVGRIDEARRAYEAALALEPNYKLARGKLAQLSGSARP